jgi:hypothetical protein
MDPMAMERGGIVINSDAGIGIDASIDRLIN